MGLCMKCGGPVEDDQTVCENCRVAQEQSENETAAKEEVKLVPIQEPDAQNQPVSDLVETAPSAEEKPKNNKTVKIIAIVAAALVVLTGAFFVGKTFFGRDIMQMVEGKSRYAQNIEQAATNSVAKQFVESIDKSIVLTKSAKQDKANETEISNKLTIEDAYLNAMNLGSEGTAVVKQTMQYFNSIKFKTNSIMNAGNIQSVLSLSDKDGAFLNLNTIMSKDGKSFIQIPDISKKYLSIKGGASVQSMLDLVSNLKYDSNKLNASLKKIADAYSNEVGKAAITAENDQTLTVDGVVIQGQKLTATLNTAQTTAMVKAVIEAAKNDEYLFTVISENYPAIVSKLNEIYGAGIEPAKLVKEDYNRYFDTLISDFAADKDAKSFSAGSYITRDGTLLAHCYTISDSTGVRKVDILFPKNTLVFSMSGVDKSSFTFSKVAASEEAGKIQIKFKNPEQLQNVGLTIDYSGYKTGKFMGTDQLFGKYKISLFDPDDTLAKSLNSKLEVFKKLGSSTLTVQSTLEGTDKINSTFELSLPGIVTYSMSGKTISKTSAAITVPEDAGQIIDLTKQNTKEVQKQYTVDSIKYVSGLLDSHSDLAAVLENFGLTKEMLAMYVQYASK